MKRDLQEQDLEFEISWQKERKNKMVVINQMMIDHGPARTAGPIRDMIKTTRDYVFI